MKSDVELWRTDWMLTRALKEQKRGRAHTDKTERKKNRREEEERMQVRSAEDEKCYRENGWIQARQQSNEEMSTRGEEQKKKRHIREQEP